MAQVTPISLVVPSPVGVRRGSSAYLHAKVEGLQSIVNVLSNRAVGPAESGIMEVAQTQPVRDGSRHRITDGHGSSTMQDLFGQRVRQREEREAAAAAKHQMALQRAAAKAASSAKSVALFEAWSKCRDGCKCAGAVDDDAGPCAVSRLVLCPHCDVLKPRLCGVRACKSAAAAAAAATAAAADPAEIDIDDDDDDVAMTQAAF